MDILQFNRAKVLVPTLNTTDTVALKSAMIAVDFAWGDDSAAIEWWKSTREEKLELEGLLALPQPAPHTSGPKPPLPKLSPAQAKCKLLFSTFCTPLSLNQSKDAVASALTGEFNRSGWLKYYFSEAAQAVALAPATDPNYLLVSDIANSFFLKSGASYEVKRSYDSIDPQIFRQLLTVLLTIGFERVPATKQHMLAGDSSTAMIMNYMRWAGDPPAEGLLPRNGAEDVKRLQAQFKWRCDSRKYEEVSKSNGFLTKAYSEGYAKAKGLREAWHPFNDDGLRSYLWFRKGQTDNCLYSVVSVGTGDWQAFAVYPKISLSSNNGKASGLNGYLRERDVLCKNVKTGKLSKLKFPVTETYLYFFLQVGLVFDTGAAQGKNAYPEVGMASIPMSNIYGALRVVRYHRGDLDSVSDEAGMIICIDKGGSQLNDDDAKSIQASCGQDLYQTAAAQFARVRDSGPMGVKWTPNGYASISSSAPFTYGPDDTQYVFDEILRV